MAHRSCKRTGVRRGATHELADAVCVVCSEVAFRDRRRRYCGSVCRVRAGRGDRLDRICVARLEAARPQTAANEVGHAIVGRALGWSVEAIDLEITNDRVGQVLCVGHGGRLDDDDPLDAVTVDLAGYVAGRLFDGEDDGPAYAVEQVMLYIAHPRPDLGEDVANARYSIPESVDTDEGIRRFAQGAAERADRILRQSWDAVEVVAAALLERGRLDGADVEAILAHQPTTQGVAGSTGLVRRP